MGRGMPAGWSMMHQKRVKLLASQLEWISFHRQPTGWENHRVGLGGIKRELNRHLLSHILPHVPTTANPRQVHEASWTSNLHLELLSYCTTTQSPYVLHFFHPYLDPYSAI